MAAQVPQPVLDYLASKKTVTLATAALDGTPHASTFMYVNDGLSIYFWARPTSTTAQHIHANPRVSFAIDDYVEDWNKAKGIQGDGEGQLVSDGEEVVKVVGLFADRFTSPSSGASTTNIAFFRITPQEMHFIENEGQRVSFGGDAFGMDFHRKQVLSDA